MSEKALRAINKHVKICEKQNVVVLERLGQQDEVLGSIVTGIKFVKMVSSMAATLIPILTLAYMLLK